MKVRLKKNYKTKGHEHFLPKNTTLTIQDTFEFCGDTFYQTDIGIDINSKDVGNFDDLFIKIGED